MSVNGKHQYRRLAQALRHQRRQAGLAMTYAVVLIGTILVGLGMVSMTVLAHDVSAGHARALAASPQFTDDTSSTYVMLSFAAIDNKPVTLVVIDPSASGAVVPPGIPDLPGPGEAYVSPQLRDELTGERAELFGHVVGTIDRSSLETPNERRVYMRVSNTAHRLDGMLPVSQFGAISLDEGGTVVGAGELYRVPLPMSMFMVAITVLVPGLVTLGIGVASGSEHIRRSYRMLAGIGFSRGHFLIVDILEHLPFVVSGAFVVLCGVLALRRWDLVIPFLDARYTAYDMRAIAPLTFAMVVASCLVSFAAIVMTRWAVRMRVMRARPTTSRSRATQGLTTMIFVALLIASVIVPQLIPRSPFKGLLVIALGLIEASITWAPVAFFCSLIGAGCLAYTSRRCAPAALVMGRSLKQSGIRHSSVVVGVSAVILIAGLLQLKASSMTGQMTDAQVNIDRYGSQVLELSGLTTHEVPDEFLENLPHDVMTMGTAMVATENSSAVLLVGSCQELMHVGFHCPGKGQQNWQEVPNDFAAFVTGTHDPVLLVEADPGTVDEATPLLVSHSNNNLDIDGIQTLASSSVPGTVVKERSSWLVAATQVMREAQWCMFTSAIGGVGVLFALGVSITTSVRRESYSIAPIGAVTGAAYVSGASAAASVGIPILASGVLATIVYNILPLGMAAVINDPYLPNWQSSPLFTAGALILSVLTAFITAGHTYRTARSDSLKWRPGQ